MRILHTIAGYPPWRSYGPQKHVHQLASFLGKKGHECSVLTIGYNMLDKSTIEWSDDYKIIWCKSFFKVGNISIAHNVIKNILSIPADIIHLHEYRTPLLEIVAKIATLRKIPYVITPHGTIAGPYEQARRIYDMLPYLLYDIITRRFVLKNAIRILTTCATEARQALDLGINPNCVHSIPLGIDPPKNLNELKALIDTDHPPSILFVGRISSTRNIPMLLRAVREVKRQIPNIRLKLVGDYQEESSLKSGESYQLKIHRLIQFYDLTKNVHHIGWRTGDKLWKEYLSSDIFVWPSFYDNFGYPLVEAALCSLPIVSTPVGVASALIGHNEGGFMIDQNDHIGFAHAITTLLQDTSMREDAGKWVTEVASHFSIQKVVNAHERLYKEIVQ